MLYYQLEHESNGRDSNSPEVSTGLASLANILLLQYIIPSKVTVPYLLDEGNSDILDYRGTGFYTVDYKSLNDKWRFSGTFSPKKSVKSANLKLTVAYKISDRFNQYIFTEFYSGTGDTLLEYKRKDVQLRVGISIKPDFYNVF